MIILAVKEKRDAILNALYEDVGLNSAGQGIAFSLPVDGVVGLPSEKTPEVKPKNEQLQIM